MAGSDISTKYLVTVELAQLQSLMDLKKQLDELSAFDGKTLDLGVKLKFQDEAELATGLGSKIGKAVASEVEAAIKEALNSVPVGGGSRRPRGGGGATESGSAQSSAPFQSADLVAMTKALVELTSTLKAEGRQRTQTPSQQSVAAPPPPAPAPATRELPVARKTAESKAAEVEPVKVEKAQAAVDDMAQEVEALARDMAKWREAIAKAAPAIESLRQEEVRLAKEVGDHADQLAGGANENVVGQSQGGSPQQLQDIRNTIAAALKAQAKTEQQIADAAKRQLELRTSGSTTAARSTPAASSTATRTAAPVASDVVAPINFDLSGLEGQLRGFGDLITRNIVTPLQQLAEIDLTRLGLTVPPVRPVASGPDFRGLETQVAPGKAFESKVTSAMQLVENSVNALARDIDGVAEKRFFPLDVAQANQVGAERRASREQLTRGDEDRGDAAAKARRVGLVAAAQAAIQEARDAQAQAGQRAGELKAQLPNTSGDARLRLAEEIAKVEGDAQRAQQRADELEDAFLRRKLAAKEGVVFAPGGLGLKLPQRGSEQDLVVDDLRRRQALAGFRGIRSNEDVRTGIPGSQLEQPGNIGPLEAPAIVAAQARIKAALEAAVPEDVRNSVTRKSLREGDPVAVGALQDAAKAFRATLVDILRTVPKGQRGEALGQLQAAGLQTVDQVFKLGGNDAAADATRVLEGLKGDKRKGSITTPESLDAISTSFRKGPQAAERITQALERIIERIQKFAQETLQLGAASDKTQASIRALETELRQLPEPKQAARDAESARDAATGKRKLARRLFKEGAAPEEVAQARADARAAEEAASDAEARAERARTRRPRVEARLKEKRAELRDEGVGPGVALGFGQSEGLLKQANKGLSLLSNLSEARATQNADPFKGANGLLQRALQIVESHRGDKSVDKADKRSAIEDLIKHLDIQNQTFPNDVRSSDIEQRKSIQRQISSGNRDLKGLSNPTDILAAETELKQLRVELERVTKRLVDQARKEFGAAEPKIQQSYEQIIANYKKFLDANPFLVQRLGLSSGLEPGAIQKNIGALQTFAGDLATNLDFFKELSPQRAPRNQGRASQVLTEQSTEDPGTVARLARVEDALRAQAGRQNQQGVSKRVGFLESERARLRDQLNLPGRSIEASPKQIFQEFEGQAIPSVDQLVQLLLKDRRIADLINFSKAKGKGTPGPFGAAVGLKEIPKLLETRNQIIAEVAGRFDNRDLQDKGVLADKDSPIPAGRELARRYQEALAIIKALPQPIPEGPAVRTSDRIAGFAEIPKQVLAAATGSATGAVQQAAPTSPNNPGPDPIDILKQKLAELSKTPMEPIILAFRTLAELAERVSAALDKNQNLLAPLTSAAQRQVIKRATEAVANPGVGANLTDEDRLRINRNQIFAKEQQAANADRNAQLLRERIQKQEAALAQAQQGPTEIRPALPAASNQNTNQIRDAERRQRERAAAAAERPDVQLNPVQQLAQDRARLLDEIARASDARQAAADLARAPLRSPLVDDGQRNEAIRINREIDAADKLRARNAEIARNRQVLNASESAQSAEFKRNQFQFGPLFSAAPLRGIATKLRDLIGFSQSLGRLSDQYAKTLFENLSAINASQERLRDNVLEKGIREARGLDTTALKKRTVDLGVGFQKQNAGLRANLAEAIQADPAKFGGFAPALERANQTSESRARADQRIKALRDAAARDDLAPGTAGSVAEKRLRLLQAADRFEQTLGVTRKRAEDGANQGLREGLGLFVERERALGKELGLFDRLGLSARKLVLYASVSGFVFKIFQELTRAVDTSIQLEQSAARLQGILGQSGGAGRQRITDQIFGLSKEFGVPTAQAAQSIQTFAQAGFRGPKATEAARQALRGQLGAGLEPGQATELLIAIQNISKGAITFENILDRISRIESQRAVSAQDLAISLQRVGSIAKQLQPERLGLIDFADTVIAATTSIVEKTRVSGNQAATSLRFIFSRLLSPEVASKLQGQFGIKLAGNNPNELRPLVDILGSIAQEFKARTDRGDTVGAQRLLSLVGGARQSNVAAALLTDFGDTLKIAQESSRAFGDTQRRVALQLDTLATKIEQTRTAFAQFLQNLLEKTGVLDGLKSLLDQANGIKPGTTAAGVSAFGGTIALGGAALGVLTGPLKALGTRLATPRAAFSLGTPGLGNGVIGGALEARSLGSAGGRIFGGLFKSLGLLTSGFELLLGPLGLLIAGIAGVAAITQAFTAKERAARDLRERFQVDPGLVDPTKQGQTEFFKDFANTARSLEATPQELIDAVVASNRTVQQSAKAKFGEDLFARSDATAGTNPQAFAFIREELARELAKSLPALRGRATFEQTPEGKDGKVTAEALERASQLLSDVEKRLGARSVTVAADLQNKVQSLVDELQSRSTTLGVVPTPPPPSGSLLNRFFSGVANIPSAAARAVDRTSRQLAGDQVGLAKQVLQEQGLRVSQQDLLELGGKQFGLVGAPAKSAPAAIQVQALSAGIDTVISAATEGFAAGIGRVSNGVETFDAVVRRLVAGGNGLGNALDIATNQFFALNAAQELRIQEIDKGIGEGVDGKGSGSQRRRIAEDRFAKESPESAQIIRQREAARKILTANFDRIFDPRGARALAEGNTTGATGSAENGAAFLRFTAAELERLAQDRVQNQVAKQASSVDIAQSRELVQTLQALTRTLNRPETIAKLGKIQGNNLVRDRVLDIVTEFAAASQTLQNKKQLFTQAKLSLDQPKEFAALTQGLLGSVASIVPGFQRDIVRLNEQIRRGSGLSEADQQNLLSAGGAIDDNGRAVSNENILSALSKLNSAGELIDEKGLARLKAQKQQLIDAAQAVKSNEPLFEALSDEDRAFLEKFLAGGFKPGEGLEELRNIMADVARNAQEVLRTRETEQRGLERTLILEETRARVADRIGQLTRENRLRLAEALGPAAAAIARFQLAREELQAALKTSDLQASQDAARATLQAQQEGQSKEDTAQKLAQIDQENFKRRQSILADSQIEAARNLQGQLDATVLQQVQNINQNLERATQGFGQVFSSLDSLVPQQGGIQAGITTALEPLGTTLGEQFGQNLRQSLFGQQGLLRGAGEALFRPSEAEQTARAQAEILFAAHKSGADVYAQTVGTTLRAGADAFASSVSAALGGRTAVGTDTGVNLSGFASNTGLASILQGSGTATSRLAQEFGLGNTLPGGPSGVASAIQRLATKKQTTSLAQTLGPGLAQLLLPGEEPQSVTTTGSTTSATPASKPPGALENAARAASLVIGNLAGTALGNKVGGKGRASFANVGSSIGTALGSGLQKGVGFLGKAFGFLGPALGPIGGIVGGLLGGLLGGLFSKKQKVVPELSALERIERNTRETVSVITAQNQLFNLDNRLLNVPSTFSVPDYRPLSVGGGIQANGMTGLTTNGVAVNIVINDARDPNAVATAVSQTLQRELRQAGVFVSPR